MVPLERTVQEAEQGWRGRRLTTVGSRARPEPCEDTAAREGVHCCDRGRQACSVQIGRAGHVLSQCLQAALPTRSHSHDPDVGRTGARVEMMLMRVLMLTWKRLGRVPPPEATI